MPLPNQHQIVSRRTALTGLGAGAALLASAGVTYAQDVTPGDIIGHPLVGMWVSAFDTSFVYNVFQADGTFISLSPFAGMGVGQWQATGERTGEAMLKHLNIAGEAGVVEPGVVTVWSSITVDEVGNKNTVEGVVELRIPDGTVVALFPTMGEADRFTIEPRPTLPPPEIATPTT